MELDGALADCAIERGLDGMFLGKRIHPGGKEQVQLLHWELVEDAL